MLDFGWSEFFLIIVLAIVLMGPKDVPEIVYQFGRLVRRIQYMKFAMSQQFNSFMEKADLHELRKGGSLGIGELDPRTLLSMPMPRTGLPSKAPVPDQAKTQPPVTETPSALPDQTPDVAAEGAGEDMDEDESYHYVGAPSSPSPEQDHHDYASAQRREH